jgi:hypothetical protein
MDDDRTNENRHQPGRWQADLPCLPPGESTRYSYEIVPRPTELGGGWRLRLLEDGLEVGGGVFALAQSTDLQGISWWNGLDEKDRAYWLTVAGSAVPADAWQAWLQAEAYADAEDEAASWLDGRDNAREHL